MTDVKTVTVKLSLPEETLRYLQVYAHTGNSPIDNAASAAILQGIEADRLLFPNTFEAYIPLPHKMSTARRLRDENLKKAFEEGHRFGHAAGVNYAHTPNDVETDWQISETKRLTDG